MCLGGEDAGGGEQEVSVMVCMRATFGVVWCVFVEVWGVLGVFPGTDCFNTKSK